MYDTLLQMPELTDVHFGRQYEELDVRKLQSKLFGSDPEQFSLPHLRHLAYRNMSEQSHLEFWRTIIHHPSTKTLSSAPWAGMRLNEDSVCTPESPEQAYLATILESNLMLVLRR